MYDIYVRQGNVNNLIRIELNMGLVFNLTAMWSWNLKDTYMYN